MKLKSKHIKARAAAHRTQSGQVMIASVIFFLGIGLAIITGVSQTTIRDLQASQNVLKSRESYAVAEALHEDVLYRLQNGMNVSTIENLTLNGYSASTTVTDVSGGKQVTSVGDRDSFIKKVSSYVVTGSGTSFNYGVQAGEGGIELQNTSSILGNAYSNGPIVGAGRNMITGTVVSAGPTGSVTKINSAGAAGSMYAKTIDDSVVDKDAYYQTISGSSVGGVSYSGSANQATSSMPISDTTLDQWEADAAAGGVITTPCPYSITSTVVLGPVKIDCDLNISNSGVLNLAGMVWVKGNVSISNSATVNIDPSISGRSAAIIADNPANRTGAGTVSLSNSSTFLGSGNNSYVMLVSRNTSASAGGGTTAISVANSISGKLLLYAPHGLVTLSNNVSLKEATAWKLRLSNSASVTYESGLANVLFTSGPSGGYQIDSWQEVQ